jgi:hypothetical protein
MRTFTLLEIEGDRVKNIQQIGIPSTGTFKDVLAHIL